VVKLPLFRHDRIYFDGLVAMGFLVDDVDLHETVRGGDSQPCKRAWTSARDVPGRIVRLAPAAIGDSFLSAVTGCRDVSSAPECAGGANLRTSVARLDTAALPTRDPDGGVTLAIQIANLSPAPELQGIDVFLQPRRTSDGGAAADGQPIPLATGLARGEVSAAAVALDLAEAERPLSDLVLTPHGAAPCAPGGGCSSLRLPIEPFRARYAAPTGGATGAAWHGHQVLAIFGSAELAGDASSVSTVRLAIFEASFAP
jgi:hypothetical protein